MLGLLGGLGVGAAIHYYRELAAAHDREGRPMALAMVHASIARATAYTANGDRAGLAAYLGELLARLQGAGATLGVLPALTPHFCINELKAISPIPVMDLTEVIADYIAAQNIQRVALFGTRYVVESNLYGRLGNASLPTPAEVAFIHDAYTRLAHTGRVVSSDRDRLVALADVLRQRDGVDAIVLAGTDFALMFDADHTPFPHVDCTRVHLDAIMRAA